MPAAPPLIVVVAALLRTDHDNILQSAVHVHSIATTIMTTTHMYYAVAISAN